MPRTRSERQALSDALRDVEHATGGVQHKTAAKMGISRRTLERYSLLRSFPPRKKAIAMLSRLTDLPAALYTRIAEAFDVPPHERPLLPVAPNPKEVDHVAEQSAMALVLYAAAEANGVPPKAARSIALAVLAHTKARGLDVGAAHRVVAATVKSAK